MRTINVWFACFWGGFNYYDNFFVDMLRLAGFNVVVDGSNPDVVFYSVFGPAPLNYGCKRIFFTGENSGPPNFNECHYALTSYFMDDEPRHFRIPLYTIYCREYIKAGFFTGYDEFTKPRKSIDEVMSTKTNFCNFIYTRCCEPRNSFMQQLCQYKKVDSGGGCLNNIGGKVGDKNAFIRNYKFTIAFENGSDYAGLIGYTTEKLFEPMMCNTLPIYWGNQHIHKDFNTNTFINYHDFNSFDDLINHIIKVDNDDNLYYNYLKESYVLSYENSYFNVNKISDYFKQIL